MRIAVLATVAGLAASASAFGASLQSFGNGGNLDGYIGTGISDANMVVNSNVAKVGIKGFERFVGDLPNNGVDTFYAQPGFSSFPPPSVATWNYVWAIDAGANKTIGDYQINFTVDFDPAAVNDPSKVVTIDVTSFLNATAKAGTKLGSSENLAFGYWSLPPFSQSFNPHSPGKYDFSLSVTPIGGTPLISSMSVVVVPLPAAVWAGIALLGAAGVGRFARKSIA